MDIISLLVGILLLGIALWIWQFTKTKLENFEVRSSRQINGKAKFYLKSLMLTGVRLRKIVRILLSFITLFALILIVFLDGFGLIRINNLFWVILLITDVILITSTFIQSHPAELPDLYRRPSREFEHFEYIGDATLPKRVYVGDSENLSIDLRRVRRILSGIEETFSSQDKEGGKFITILIREDATLEVELQAAALNIDPKPTTQRQPISLKDTLSYRWNCYFPNSGKQLITLIFNVLRSSDSFPLGVIEHSIKVVQFAFLTQRQVRILAAVIAIVGFIGTVIGIVLKIPALLHLFAGH